jgi:type VI secretion system protein VasD
MQMTACSAPREVLQSADAARAHWLPAGALLLLAGCSSAPAPPPATVVSIQITADANANATLQGEGAPVAIRVYQLASRSGFDGAEFYRLYSADAATLGSDLIKKDELLLTPGTSKSLTLMPADPVHAIGVFAAYRDFQHVTWRAAADLPAHQATTVTVTADRAGIKLAATPGKPASP